MNYNWATTCCPNGTKQAEERSRKSEMESYLNLLEESFPGIKNNIIRCESLGFEWAGEGRIFVKEENGKAVCHVGYYETSALIEGSWCKIGALHAICTQSSCRNQGHASQLILDALKWAERHCSIIILFTEIPKFYTRLSFREIQEYRFHLPCEHVRGDKVLRQIQIPNDSGLFLRCFREREPLSHRFWIKDNGAIASFNTLFATYPTFWSLHYSPAIDGLLSFKVENQTLHLFDVVAKKIPPLELILNHFQAPIKDIYFYFSPDRFTQSAMSEPYLYDHGHLMVHGAMPAVGPFMIAPLSRC